MSWVITIFHAHLAYFCFRATARPQHLTLHGREHQNVPLAGASGVKVCPQGPAGLASRELGSPWGWSGRRELAEGPSSWHMCPPKTSALPSKTQTFGKLWKFQVINLRLCALGSWAASPGGKAKTMCIYLSVPVSTSAALAPGGGDLEYSLFPERMFLVALTLL